MAEYDQFLPAITAFVSNRCPRLIMLNAVKSVVRQFCDDSNIWVYDCPEFIIEDQDISKFKLEIPYQSTICKLWSIHGREALHNTHQLYREQPYYHLTSNSELVFEESKLHCLPKKINCVVSLSPTQDSLTCPDFIFQRYHDAIVSAAIVRLQLMPSQEWNNPSMVEPHSQLYQQYLAQAIRDREDGFMMARQVRRVVPYYM